jgi:hypothetical protein
LIRELFVHFTAMADGEDADRSALVLDRIDDAEASHPVLSQSFQVAQQRLAGERISAERPKRLFNAALDIWRKVTDNVRYMGRDIWPENGHQRLRFFGA